MKIEKNRGLISSEIVKKIWLIHLKVTKYATAGCVLEQNER